MQTSLDLFALPARRHCLEYWIMYVAWAGQEIPHLHPTDLQYVGLPSHPDWDGTEELLAIWSCKQVETIPDIVYWITSSLIADGFWIWECYIEQTGRSHIHLHASRWLAGEQHTGQYAYQQRPEYLGWTATPLCWRSTPAWCNGGTP